MDVGLKESSEKKLMRSTRTGHVENMRTKKLAESRCPESGGETEARKTEIATGVCIKSDLERVGE